MTKAQRVISLKWVKAFDKCLKDGRDVVLLKVYYPVQRALF